MKFLPHKHKVIKAVSHSAHLSYFGMIVLHGPYQYAAAVLFFMVIIEWLLGED